MRRILSSGQIYFLMIGLLASVSLENSARCQGVSPCLIPRLEDSISENRGEPTSLQAAFEQIKNLPKFPFKEARGHWIKTSDGSYIHTLFEPALLPNGKQKVASSPTLVLLTGLSGRTRDTYASGYVDELRRQGLNIVIVEENGDGWTELYRRYEAHHRGMELPDRYLVNDQAKHVVEAVQGLSKVLRSQGHLKGNSKFYLAGNSYGAWVAQKIASGPQKEFFQKYILLGPGTESLHRSLPGVREMEDWMDCLAGLACTGDSRKVVTDFTTQLVAKATRAAYQAHLEGLMDLYLPSYLKENFPIFKYDAIRLESAIRKFKGIWTFDTKKVARDMRGVTLITARRDSVMPTEQGIIVHDELGVALQKSKEFGGWIEIGDADHDFLSTGLRDPIYNQTAVLIGHVVKENGPVAQIPADRSKVIIESLQNIQQIRPAYSVEVQERSPVVNAPVDAARIQFVKTLKQLDELREAAIKGHLPGSH